MYYTSWFYILTWNNNNNVYTQHIFIYSALVYERQWKVVELHKLQSLNQFNVRSYTFILYTLI